ncbi:Limbic system-associated membrane protein [Merluccius polli]|uniref:Limbic system-associated membrane protein n=1 Tax=Merluccius polli TaxID=89951 RepID=A0AA47MIM5_MERPO|nr:Limbic system-associated membrane protein [Merluccius polli]
MVTDDTDVMCFACMKAGAHGYVCRGAEPLDGEEYLDISGIMRNQAGRYECKASNDVATPDVKYVNVVVNYPPAIKKTQSSETPVGRMGMLHCDATAVPTPEFEWYRDDKRLSNSQGINIHTLGTTTILTIANVTEEDYGNYTCVASNRLGIQNASLFLYRPGMGRNNGSACVSQSLWLLLVCITCLLFKAEWDWQLDGLTTTTNTTTNLTVIGGDQNLMM